MAVAKALDSSPPEQIAAVAGGQADGEVSSIRCSDGHFFLLLHDGQNPSHDRYILFFETILTLCDQALMAMKDLMNRLGSELVSTEEAAPCSDLR